jgi:hypothetical protein
MNEVPENDSCGRTSDPYESWLPDSQPRCPDCAVAVGEPHLSDPVNGACDIARCLVTGLQRWGCQHDHDCGRDIWTGFRPGQLDCERLGFMQGNGFPDLNRLYVEATWDRERLAWVKPAP